MKLILTKTTNLNDAIEQTFTKIKEEKGKVCIIVPDKLTVSLEKQLFKALNLECSFDIEVSTLTRYSQKILTELNVDYTPISKLGSIILIKKLLQEHNKELKLFNSPSFSYKYSETLFKTLSQFKSSNITADDIVIDKPCSKQLTDKLLDIKLILENYEFLKAGLIDPSDRLNLFCANLHKSKLVQDTSFYFIGFTDFTQQGYLVIEQLTRYSKCVNVACYQSNYDNKNIFPDDVISHLINTAYNCAFPLEIIENKSETDPLHKFLSTNLFALSNNKFETNAINLFNGKNVLEEIEFAIRSIRAEIIKGKQYNKFGIACFQLEKHALQIQNTCEKYELNYYIDNASNLADSFYFKFFYNFLKLYADNFRLENLLHFINSDFIKIEKSQKIKLNRYLREINFSGNLNYLLPTEELEKEIEYLKSLLNGFSFSSITSIAEVKEQINRVSELLNIDEIVQGIINRSSSLYNKKILSQSKTSFTNLLEEIEKFYDKVSLEELLDILESSAREQKIMPIPQSLDCVQIVDAGEILTSFEHLYIINCSHSNAPQITQDIGIILDSNINNLPFKKKLSPTIAYLNKMSKLKLFNSIQMFKIKLTVCMSTNHESQKSEIVKELENRITANNQPLTAINYEEYLKSYTLLSKWDAIEFLSANYSEENNKILKTFGIDSFNMPHYLNSDCLTLLDFNQISCSALENYFKCPMLYFLSNCLKLKEEATAGIAMVDVGNILHQLAQDFYKIANRYSLNIEQFCTLKIEGYINSDKRLKVYLNSPIHLNLVKEGIRFLNHLNYLDENSEFIPTFFEYEFDSKFNRTIPLTDEVFLRGKIDRIDFYNNYIRIIDYKTGSASANLQELYYGKKLQLFLYGKTAEAVFNKSLAGSFYLPVKNNIGKENEIQYKLTGFYQNNLDIAKMLDKRITTSLKSDLLDLSLDKEGKIKQDARSYKVLYPSQFNKLLDYSVEVSKKAIAEIKSGYIYPNPIKYDETKNSCSYCKYLSICRRNSLDIKFRTCKEVNLNSFGGETNG